MDFNDKTYWKEAVIKFIQLLNSEDEEKAIKYLENFDKDERDVIISFAKQLIFDLRAEGAENMSNACYSCKYRSSVPGSHHSSCRNQSAMVKGSQHGIRKGWFMHPFDYDPVWLKFCDSFEKQNHS